jgi:hypothetical protein
LKKLLILALMGVSVAAMAQSPAYFTGSLTANSPTYVRPNGTTGGTYAYSAQAIWVTVSGTYTFETASPATGIGDSLDTYLVLYNNPFVPASSTAVNFNDDFTGAFTVLPGPYAGNGVTGNATGFAAPMPGSRFTNALTANTTYWVVNTSFSQNTVTGQIGGLGTFYTGIGGGPGNVNLGPVPEPASLAVLGLGALALLRRRKKA